MSYVRLAQTGLYSSGNHTHHRTKNIPTDQNIMCAHSVTHILLHHNPPCHAASVSKGATLLYLL